MPHRVCLLILDGVGYSENVSGNAVRRDTMPALFDSMDKFGFATLGAAAESVGLEPGQVGNSEAGHLTIGAGRTVPCLTRRISDSFDAGDWAADSGWQIALESDRLHVVGLLSDAGVHGLARTIEQAIHAARDAGVNDIIVHPVLDGIDSLQGSAPRLLTALTASLATIEGVRFGVVAGRRNFCDRSGNLDVTRLYTDAVKTEGALPPFSDAALANHLRGGKCEADFGPHMVPGGLAIRPGEPVLITSHRADRARQVARVFSETQPVLMIADPGKDVPVSHVFFPQRSLETGLAQELRRAGLESVRIAEKCKFPHVTHFLNGFDASLEGEGICIPSIPEAEIARSPEMSVRAISEKVVECLGDTTCRVVIANFANLDQVGHLGQLELAERAAMLVDGAFAQVREAAARNGWELLVTADHGNADRVESEDGHPFGSHTTCPVPFLVIPAPDRQFDWTELDGTLANVASTCLLGLDIDPPDWMAPSLGHFANRS